MLQRRTWRASEAYTQKRRDEKRLHQKKMREQKACGTREAKKCRGNPEVLSFMFGNLYITSS